MLSERLERGIGWVERATFCPAPLTLAGHSDVGLAWAMGRTSQKTEPPKRLSASQKGIIRNATWALLADNDTGDGAVLPRRLMLFR